MGNYLQAIGVRLINKNSVITDVVVLAANGDVSMVELSDIIKFINGGNVVFTEIDGRRTPVYVVNGPVRKAYIRTQPNESIEDNLLSLPKH